MNKKQILVDAVKHRENEVLLHQINIDNYTLAIAEIELNMLDKPHMVAFADRLRELLKSSIEEQDKEKVLLKVIRQQLELIS